ncbi:hypothetical protein CK203_007036 [Vitis vinifera]|uniref:Uncharacterized protein n=1 Tax=Vitis vinifera TaxID=29760 RepID=A0A438KBZ6_VITVI|nr:hypothetical protein CK203_007036 [Vitis vinifera]
MAEQGVDPMAPPFLHLLSAFLAMEPTHCLISLARVCGGGLITEGVQRFIWDNCISKVSIYLFVSVWMPRKMEEKKRK